MAELDVARAEAISAATVAALQTYGDQLHQLALVEVTGSSPDGRVLVRANGGGGLTGLQLRDGVLHRYDAAALSELVTRTVRETQRRAKEQYEHASAAILPPELAANEAENTRVWRD
jgi:DNA-binding protein YbaB